jgi:RNA polymerase sigma factor (sigma-70 family)
VSLIELDFRFSQSPEPDSSENGREERSEAELLLDFAKSGDHATFEALSRRVLPFIERIAAINPERRAGGIPVEEVVQEVLLNLFRYAGSFKLEKSYAFQAWLRRIVWNAVSQIKRQRAGVPSRSLDEFESIEIEDLKSKSPLHALCHEDEIREGRSQTFLISLRVAAAWRLLTGLQKEILRRVCFEGKTYAEIGKDMGMNPDAVKMAAFRGRRRLQKQVFPEGTVEEFRAVI